jgi:hypothetical protein
MKGNANSYLNRVVGKITLRLRKIQYLFTIACIDIIDDLPKTIINTINGRSSTVNHSEKDNINFVQSEPV